MIRVAVVLISSKIQSGQKPDENRKPLERILTNHQLTLLSYDVVADDRQAISRQLDAICETTAPHIILTLGGTGVRPTDWAPEATRDVIEKEIPGIGEAMRAESLKKVRTAMLSRGTAGIKGTTLILNLPGSINGVQENLNIVLPLLEHMVEKMGSMATS
ncbi:MogA/MoaB family molybdenum cofactor biosynthesis protein [Candidatus Nitrospira allomarina]|uniref:Molybdopterin adenylyltransferase n=1 Tax=Candidatus Nitrospira allomarina TaxID=3020900 RepID=A0AA96GKU1_9BACT|nr:MogA/MoaB family molybdenum cofactor biosynthesis protein [Candidatus Nitrospira allomarina]WNM60154.1 MogA/MoaB family molybdenum cofactor biosynthesis protein [Candidatus Nitrospira allomarina]